MEVPASLSQDYACRWNFGDGAGDTPPEDCTYESVFPGGLHTVSVYVVNNAGEQSSKQSVTFAVKPKLQITSINTSINNASVFIDGKAIQPDQTITFRANVPAELGQDYACRWDLGTGNFGTFEDCTATKQFGPGEVTIKVYLVNNSGEESEQTSLNFTVVQPPPPPPANIVPDARTDVTAANTQTVEKEVKETIKCRQYARCNVGEDNKYDGRITYRWTRESGGYEGSDVGCPQPETVNAPDICPAPEQAVVFDENNPLGSFTKVVDIDGTRKIEEVVTVGPQCDYLELPPVQYDCSNGKRCFSDFFSSTATACNPQPLFHNEGPFKDKSYHCVTDDSCADTGTGYIEGVASCVPDKSEREGGCYEDKRLMQDFYRDNSTDCLWTPSDPSFHLKADPSCLNQETLSKECTDRRDCGSGYYCKKDYGAQKGTCQADSSLSQDQPVAVDNRGIVEQALSGVGDFAGGVGSAVSTTTGFLGDRVDDLENFITGGGLNYQGDKEDLYLNTSIGLVNMLATLNNDFARSSEAGRLAVTTEEVINSALTGGDAKEGLKLLGIDLDAADAQGQNYSLGFCLGDLKNPILQGAAVINPAANLVYNVSSTFSSSCIAHDTFLPSSTQGSLAATVRAESVRGLAREMGLNLDQDPNEWDPSTRDIYFDKVRRNDFNLAKSTLEMIGVPVATIEDARNAQKICEDSIGKSCFASLDNPSVYTEFSESDFTAINERATKLNPEFEPVSSDLLQQYSQLVFSTSYYQQGSQTASEIQRAREDQARKLNISLEELANVEATYQAYADAGKDVLENTSQGRLMQEYSTKATLETAIGIATTAIDPSITAELIGGAVKATIAKSALQRLVKGGEEKIADEVVVRAESGLTKAIARRTEEITAQETDAITQLWKVSVFEENPNGVIPPVSQMVTDLEKAGLVVEQSPLKPLENFINSSQVDDVAKQGLEEAKHPSSIFDFEGAPTQNVVIQNTENIEWVGPPSVPDFTEVADSVKNGVDNLLGKEPEKVESAVVTELRDGVLKDEVEQAAKKGESVEILTTNGEVVADGTISRNFEVLDATFRGQMPSEVDTNILLLSEVRGLGEGEQWLVLPRNGSLENGYKLTLNVVEDTNGELKIVQINVPDDMPQSMKNNLEEALTTVNRNKQAVISEKPASEIAQNLQINRDLAETLAKEPKPQDNAGSVASVAHPSRNEDAIFTDPQARIGLVADGMGGHEGGDLASRAARDSVAQAMSQISSDGSIEEAEKAISEALSKAHFAVKEAAPNGGTTLSAVKIVNTETGPVAVWGNIGDSRIYLFRDGKLGQITKDDNSFPAAIANEIDNALNQDQLSMEAKIAFRYRNVVDQALGRNNSKYTTGNMALQKGDKIIITSDGIHDNLTTSEMESIINSSRGNESDALMQAAYERSKAKVFRSKPDDLSAVVMDVPTANPPNVKLPPCPTSLVPVAYAAVANPCAPTNPIAAAFENFKGLFSRQPEVVAPPANSQLPVSEIVNKVRNISTGDINLLDNIARQVAKESEKFDYVLTSGESRDISNTLLIKNGVDPKKIIQFGREENGIVYKTNVDLDRLTEAERTAMTRDNLAAAGIDFSGSEKPKILIVDDISDTGYKATAYLRRFSEIEDLGDVEYTALSANGGRVIDPKAAGTTNFENISKEELEQLSQRTFMATLSQPETTEAYTILDHLSYTLAGYTRTDLNIKPDIREELQQAGERALNVIYPQRNNPPTTRLTATATRSLRFGESYTQGGIEEFNALEKLYNIDPEHVAKPVRLITQGEQVIGYEREAIDGITAKQYITIYGGLTQDVKDQIVKTLDTFHQNDLAHGVPTITNILITPEGEVKFINPVSYRDFRPEFAKYDIDEVNRYLNRVNTISPPDKTPSIAVPENIKVSVPCPVGFNIIPTVYAAVANPCVTTDPITAAIENFKGIFSQTQAIPEHVVKVADPTNYSPAEIARQLGYRDFVDAGEFGEVFERGNRVVKIFLPSDNRKLSPGLLRMFADSEVKFLTKVEEGFPEATIYPKVKRLFVSEGKEKVVLGYEMEKLETLQDFIIEGKRLDPGQVDKVLEEHRQITNNLGLTWGDIKASNIGIRRNGQIVILDPAPKDAAELARKATPEVLQAEQTKLENLLRSNQLKPCPVKVGLIPVVYAQENPCKPGNIFEQARDRVTGWFDNITGRKQPAPQTVLPADKFIQENAVLVNELKSSDYISSLVASHKSRDAMKIIRDRLLNEATITDSQNDWIIPDVADEIMLQHITGGRVKKFMANYNPDQFTKLSEVSGLPSNLPRVIYLGTGDGSTLTLTESQINDIRSRVGAISEVVELPKNGIVNDPAEIIGSLSLHLQPADSVVGKDQRRLINILYNGTASTGNDYESLISLFIDSGGRYEDLPLLYANLLSKNEARYESFKDVWQPAIDIFNHDVLPLAEQKYTASGVNIGAIDPRNITWLTKEDTKLSGVCYLGFCANQTPIPDSSSQFFGMTFEKGVPDLDDDLSHKVARLTHESIHANVMNNYGNIEPGIYTNTTTAITEELTERLNQRIQEEVRKVHPELGLGSYATAYDVSIEQANLLLKYLGVPIESTDQFAIRQDTAGYIQFLDKKLNSLNDSQYRQLINNLYQSVQIGPSQHDLLLSKRAHSVVDIRQMQDTWGYWSYGSLISQGKAVTEFETIRSLGNNLVLTDASNKSILLPEGSFADIDSFGKAVEATTGVKDNDNHYLPEIYYSETSSVQREIMQNHPLRNLPSPEPSFFENIGNTISDWFDNLFNRKQTMLMPDQYISPIFIGKVIHENGIRNLSNARSASYGHPDFTTLKLS